MKITKTASGTKKITMSKNEWQAIGKQAGWVKTATVPDSKTHKNFQSKKEALRFLRDNGLMSVGWVDEDGQEKTAIYWNGKLSIRNAGHKKHWVRDEKQIQRDMIGPLKHI